MGDIDIDIDIERGGTWFRVTLNLCGDTRVSNQWKLWTA